MNNILKKYTPNMYKEKILRYLERIMIIEQSPQKVALAVSLSIYIAFSPFLFFHTIMVFVLGWLLELNVLVMLAITYAINNPLTMVPIYAIDYCIGDIVLRNLIGSRALVFNPTFMEYINGPLRVHTGIEGLSFWSFMIGGNLLGLLFGGMLYPIIKCLCMRVTGEVRIRTQR